MPDTGFAESTEPTHTHVCPECGVWAHADTDCPLFPSGYGYTEMYCPDCTWEGHE